MQLVKKVHGEEWPVLSSVAALHLPALAAVDGVQDHAPRAACRQMHPGNAEPFNAPSSGNTPLSCHEPAPRHAERWLHYAAGHLGGQPAERGGGRFSDRNNAGQWCRYIGAGAGGARPAVDVCERLHRHGHLGDQCRWLLCDGGVRLGWQGRWGRGHVCRAWLCHAAVRAFRPAGRGGV